MKAETPIAPRKSSVAMHLFAAFSTLLEWRAVWLESRAEQMKADARTLHRASERAWDIAIAFDPTSPRRRSPFDLPDDLPGPNAPPVDNPCAQHPCCDHARPLGVVTPDGGPVQWGTISPSNIPGHGARNRDE